MDKMEIMCEQKRQLLNEADAAFYICMSRAWLRLARMRKTGLPFIKIGRSIRYDVADLDEFLKTNKVKPVR